MSTPRGAHHGCELGRVVIFMAVLLAGAVAAALPSASAASATEEAGPTLTPWVSSDSYPDAPYFDSRLDGGVAFWRAGLTLGEVFAGISEQTGVEIACWPPGDQNERLRVTLFLNPGNRPSVRDLMSQLAWVTDCSFALEVTGNREAPYRYYLLSTSVADTAQARLESDREATQAAFREAWEQRAPRAEDVSSRLDEYIAALDLPTEELFTRYDGVDDHLLATMVDPRRRASVEFLATLDAESRSALLDNEALPYTWAELTGDQQAALESCLRAPRLGFGPGEGEEPDAQEGSWTGAQVAYLQVVGLAFGSPMIAAELSRGDAETRGGRHRFLMSPMLDLTGERDLAPDEIAALRRARGERVSAEEERTLFHDWSEARRSEMRGTWEQRTRRAAEERLAQQLPLSVAVENTLSSLRLPGADDTPYALWQIQEAVAKGTGLQVVSDCFSQPPRNLRADVQSLYPGEEVPMTALLALRLSAVSTEEVRGLAWARADDHRAGWEWQDAGTFLRFRSRARDLWRAAMLPPAAAAYLDSWLDPHLARAARAERSPANTDVVLGPQWISALAAGLTDLQLAQGGELICGDPAQKETAYRQQLREAVLGSLAPRAATLRALATLSDGQWEGLQGEGLRATYDLTPDQRDALDLGPRVEGSPARPGGGPDGRGRRGAGFGRGPFGGPGRGGPVVETDRDMARLVLRLASENPYRPRDGGGERGGPSEEWGRGYVPVQESDWLGFWVGDELRGARPLPRRLSVSLTLPAPSPALVAVSVAGE